MWTLIIIAVFVLAGFAIFVLLNDSRERKRDVERERLALGSRPPGDGKATPAASARSTSAARALIV